MQLEGYALALVHGQWFIGKMCYGKERTETTHELLKLEPAYQAHIRWMGDDQGNFGVLRECTPIAGSTKLNYVWLGPSSGAEIYQCSEMTGKEREAWSCAIQGAEEMVRALKTAESGLVLPPTPGGLIK